MRPSFSNQPLKVDASASEAFDSGWGWIDEPVGISKDNSFAKLGLSEQINTTADQSDYLWYSLRYVLYLLLNLQFLYSTDCQPVSKNSFVNFCYYHLAALI